MTRGREVEEKGGREVRKEGRLEEWEASQTPINEQ